MLNSENFPQKIMNNQKKINKDKYHELPSNVYEQLVNPSPTIRYYFLTQFYANHPTKSNNKRP